jgi:dUTPase
MLYVEAGIPPMKQRLLFNGNELANDSTMEHGGVVDGSTIHLTLRLVNSVGVIDSDADDNIQIQMAGGN